MSTTYKTIAGDTFESVARKMYGDDARTALVRRANPGVLEPLSAGWVLKIPATPNTPTILTRRTSG